LTLVRKVPVTGKLRRLSEIPLSRILNEAADQVGGYGTSGQVELPELGLPDAHGQPYVPSDWFALRRTMDGLVVRPTDAFLDYGAGKGRALFAAARRPFARLIGIDLSRELVEAARSNLAGHKRLVGREVVLEVADAARYDVPDDVSVAYFFCPFTGPTFAAAVERLLASIDRRPRPMLVVYMAPFEHNYLVATERMRPIASAPSRWPPRRMASGEAIVTYAVRPDGGDFPAPSKLIRRARFHDERWKGFTRPVVTLGPEFADSPLVPNPVEGA
jgi:SAM-dependent methyltransferase